MMTTRWLTGCMWLVGAAAAAAGAEPYVVWSRTADLYRQRARDGALQQGEIVAATASEDGVWLRLTREGKVYQARRRDFRDRPEVRRAMRLATVELQDGLLRLQQDIADGVRRLQGLHRSLLELGRDETVTFVVPDVHVIYPKTTTDPASGAPAPSVPRVVPQSRRVRKLSGSAVRRLQRQFEDALTEQKQAVGELRNRLAEMRRRLVVLNAEAEDYERRFDRFAVAPASYQSVIRVAADAGAALFRDRVRAEVLKGGELVWSAPHPRHRDWVLISRGDEALSGRRKELPTAASVETDYRLRRVVAEDDLAVVEAELALLEYRRGVLRELTDAVALQAESAGVHLVVTRAGDYYEVRNRYLPEGPHGVIEVLDKSDARRLLRQWRGELAEVEKAIADQRQRRLALKREQVNLEFDQEAFQRRLRAFRER